MYESKRGENDVLIPDMPGSTFTEVQLGRLSQKGRIWHVRPAFK